MALSLIAQGAVAANNDSVTVAQGDILIVFSYRSNSSTAPTAPSDFTVINSGNNTGSGTNGSYRSGYRVAGSGGFSGTGTWTNATHLAWIVLRGQKVSGPIGNNAHSVGNNASSSINYPAVGATAGATGHWYVGAVGRTAGDSTVATAPTGMTNHASAPATPLVAIHSTNGVREGSWPSTTVTLTGAKTCVNVIEILAEPASVFLSADPGAYALSGVASAPITDRVLATEVGVYTQTGIAADLVFTSGQQHFVLDADPGSFTLSGVLALLATQRNTNAAPGTFAVTGAPAAPIADRVLGVAPGVYALDGSPAAVVGHRALHASAGAFAFAGANIATLVNLVLIVDSGSYLIQSFDVALVGPVQKVPYMPPDPISIHASTRPLPVGLYIADTVLQEAGSLVAPTAGAIIAQIVFPTPRQATYEVELIYGYGATGDTTPNNFRLDVNELPALSSLIHSGQAHNLMRLRYILTLTPDHESIELRVGAANGAANSVYLGQILMTRLR